MPEYRKVKPEIGKWYVSDSGKITRRTPETKIKPETRGPRSKCVLSGPHNTKAEAEAAKVAVEEKDQSLRGHGYVWQATKADL
jgi:hypothetical protein